MKQLAPDVWAHVIDAEGFPTSSAVVLTPRWRSSSTRSPGPPRHGPGGRVPGRARPAAAASSS